MTDITPLVNDAANLFAASLVPVGTAAAAEIGSQLADGAVELGRKLWGRMRGRFPDPARIEREAVLVQGPGTRRAVDLGQELRRQLLRALEDDEDGSFAEELDAALHPQTHQSVQTNIGVLQTGPVHHSHVVGNSRGQM